MHTYHINDQTLLMNDLMLVFLNFIITISQLSYVFIKLKYFHLLYQFKSLNLPQSKISNLSDGNLRLDY
jgi:hypothetical protein